MTEPGPERPPEAAPTPDPALAPTSDLGQIMTEEELRVAVLALLGSSYDRAVERRTGLSKTTVNDLRNGRRSLTLKTLTLIVAAYDPARREAWLAAWHKLRVSGTPPVARQGAAAEQPVSSGGQRSGDPADYDGDSDQGGDSDHGDDSHHGAAKSGSTRIRQPAAVRPHPLGAFWRPLRLAVGSALVAAVATAAVVIGVFGNNDTGVPRAQSLDDSAAVAGVSEASGPVGLVPGPRPYGPGGPAYGPGGPGAAAPVGGPGPPPAGYAPPPPGDGAVVPHGCYSLPLPTTAQVVDQPGAAATGVRLTAASYSYFAAWSPSVAVGGRLSGQPPDGRRLVGAAWADPGTADSTPERNPGNGRFYPGNALELSDENCFTVPPYNIGYGGYSGITTRIYVLMVDEAGALALPREAHQLAGLTDADLVRRGVHVLGYVVVPSPG